MVQENPLSSIVYQLKVSLLGVKPEIWRRVQAPDDISLAKLHRVIQCTMGWEDYHLYAFSSGDEEYGDLSTAEGAPVRSASRARLSSLIDTPGDSLKYDYDFGDGWEHRVTLEQVIHAEPGGRYPKCVGGARACPPEDCGGPYGYADLLEALQKPRTRRHKELVEWIDGSFDPEAFDADLVNLSMARARLVRAVK
jgi:hypothetical protein